MSQEKSADQKNVVAVIDNEARIYGPRDEKSGIRPLRQIRQFTNYGQARQFAMDYENPDKK